MASVVTQQRGLDGRPLYAYKLRDGEYERLKVAVREQMPGAGRDDRRFAAMFCVYAAETFRRRHAGGPWTWETVLDGIGPTPNYQAICVWVEQGLQHFKRPLLRSRSGDREFLVTLACEGGLPLRLLHKENAHLSRYFRELLTAYHRERHTPGCDATDIARQVAARYLPASLRHDVVFKLSGDLIQSIVQLQEQVGDATDRRQVFEKVLEALGQFVLYEKRQEQLPHARELRLTWMDGSAWTLRLDQGVGYWRTCNAREPFPFEQSVERQVERLRSCEIDIEAGHPSYPTYWYVGPA